jgi:menaquinone-specific isochorismate synthase
LLKVNGVPYAYDQLKRDMDKLDILQWLSDQKNYPKVYLLDTQTRKEHAAAGSILSVDCIPHLEHASAHSIRFYGGRSFSLRQPRAPWLGFPSCRFWLPSCEIVQTADFAECRIHSLNDKAQDISLKERHSKREKSALQNIEEISSDRWKATFSSLLDGMQKNNVQKIVIARKKQLHFSHSLDAWDMLRSLKQTAQNSIVFAFQLAPHLTFLGASPEKLFSREREQVFIDAVAGTRARGQSEAQDTALEQELRTDAKEKREFAAVKAFISEAIRCSWLKDDTVIKTSHVQHLYNRAHVLLKTLPSDAELVRVLHPTPAVAGFPRNAALKLIAEHEAFDRGWYASPVGWVAQEEAQLSVAIRSGLVDKATLHLFAGAGIVPGSSLEKEWEEIEHKMRVLLYGCGLIK